MVVFCSYVKLPEGSAQVSHHPTNGITFVSGGKWTTWREMAEDGVEQVIQRHPELKKKAAELSIKIFGPLRYGYPQISKSSTINY